MPMADTDDLTSRREDDAPVPDVRDETIPPGPKVEPVKRRGGVFAPLLGGVLAAAAGFGAAQFVPQGWPLAQTDALQQALADQAALISQLEGRLGAVENQSIPDLSPMMETLATLNSRMAALENGPAERAEDNAALKAAVAKLQADLAALETSGPVPANVTALAAAAEERLKEAEAQAAKLKADAEALNKAAAQRAAFVALETAVGNGLPFAGPLADLGLEAPEALTAHAATGLPSLTNLQQSFPEAARAALEAALRADMGDSWTERATSFFRSQTGARSLTPREGTDPDAILSRAEAALTKGDLATTLVELGTLPEAAQTALADWRALVETRLAALAALQAMAEKLGG
jgi:hypothetical protein